MELLDGLSNRTRRDPPTRRWHSPLIFVVFNLWASVGFGRARTAGSCAQICNKILAAICHLSSDGNPGIDAVSLVDGSDSLIALCFRYVRLGRVGQPVLLLLIVDPSCNTKGLGRRHHASHVLFECHAGGTLWECGVCPASLRILALHRPLGGRSEMACDSGGAVAPACFPTCRGLSAVVPQRERSLVRPCRDLHAHRRHAQAATCSEHRLCRLMLAALRNQISSKELRLALCSGWGVSSPSGSCRLLAIGAWSFLPVLVL